jgi:hypothetical protein
MQIRTSSYERIPALSEPGRPQATSARPAQREIEVNPAGEFRSSRRPYGNQDDPGNEKTATVSLAAGTRAQRAVSTYLNLQQTLAAEARFDFDTLAGVDFYA